MSAHVRPYILSPGGMVIVNRRVTNLKVEYHANENPLNNSEKIAYVGQRLMCPIIILTKKLTMLVFF